MTITIPIYIEKVPSADGGDLFVVSPLFVDSSAQQAKELSKAMAKLVQALRKQLRLLARTGDCGQLLEYFAPPEWEDHSHRIKIKLRRQTVRGRFHVVALRHMGRRLAFTPTVPDLWFEYDRGEDLRGRAEKVLTHHYLHEESEWDDTDEIRTEIAGRTRTWTTSVDLEVRPPRTKRVKKKHDKPFSFLGGGRSFFGDEELEKVGRCLDYLYPHELERVAGRAAHVEELSRLLKAADKPPVLLLGPPKVGKSAVLHEVVHRIVEGRKSPYTTKKNTWLLSPQRLISGMSFVGEWEDRVLAIVEEARKREHTLCFDDILGLFQAGVCADSDLSVGHVLKPFLERREVRVVGEMTPEAFHVLQEKDRGFADLFHIIRVDEPDDALNCRIMIWVMRRLESKHRCRFGLEVLPAVLDLQRRYVRSLAFPGKAAMFLGQLAVRLAGQDVTREHVLDTFRRKSGLSVGFLDTRAKLSRNDVVEALGQRIVGQNAAVTAMADVVAVAKARLSDPERPLASFLFLGPTGVGKTQCAKTLASYLFGSEERLLRFDMNEFVSGDAVARLVGTFHAPEGLLTASIRRQPFAVVLLDEIEKADPGVFALLLQVMGEGRLTDAQGRSVDFSNAIIILTSNLGTRQAGNQLGFGSADRHQDAVYVETAEKFFAPEFFNRLDRIIPFSRLTHEEVSGIARILIHDLLGREGLARRKCVLNVAAPAMDKIVKEGFHPQLGARALKRSIEQQVTSRLAKRLSTFNPDAPTVISIHRRLDNLVVAGEPLVEAEPLRRHVAIRTRPEIEAFTERIEAMLSRVEAEIAPLAPAQPFDPTDLTEGERTYLLVREQAGKVRYETRRLRENLTRSPGRRIDPTLATPRRRFVRGREILRWKWGGHCGGLLAELAQADDLRNRLEEMADESGEAGPLGGSVSRLVDEARLLGSMAAVLQEPGLPNRTLVTARHVSGQLHLGNAARTTLLNLYREVFESMNVRVDIAEEECPSAIGDGTRPKFLMLQGQHAGILARSEEGTHLFRPDVNAAATLLTPVRLYCCPVPDEEPPESVFASIGQQQTVWANALVAGEARLEDDPSPLKPVLRVYWSPMGALDVRTGLGVAANATGWDLRNMVLGALPLPPELHGFETET